MNMKREYMKKVKIIKTKIRKKTEAIQPILADQLSIYKSIINCTKEGKVINIG